MDNIGFKVCPRCGNTDCSYNGGIRYSRCSKADCQFHYYGTGYEFALGEYWIQIDIKIRTTYIWNNPPDNRNQLLFEFDKLLPIDFDNIEYIEKVVLLV